MDIYKATHSVFRRREREGAKPDAVSKVSEGSEFSPENALLFAEHARAVPRTLQLYGRAQALRAWEFVAEFHKLDPGVLALNHEDQLAYIEQIACAAGRDGFVLAQFCLDLSELKAGLVAQMPERLNPEEDAIHMVIQRDWFQTWAKEHRWSQHPEAKPTPTSDSLLVLKDPTPLMRAFARVAEEVRATLERGGPPRAQTPGKLKWVRDLFEAAHFSKHLARAAATLVARPHQGSGRPAGS
jgi:hypothetical protein